MVLNVGDWVDLGDGRVARVIAWGDGDGTATAEMAGGLTVDRPTAFARARWRPVAADGLRVMAASDPDGLLKLASERPLDVVELALRDLGGRAGTIELRDLISSVGLPAEAWEPWWRRAQVKLEDDDRFDTSRARDKVYSLGRDSALGRLLVPALREERRRGRRMADGPQLRRARDRAQQKDERSSDDEALFERELSIAVTADADPTDRFMAAELGIWLKRWSESEARDLLGEDVISVDLLRVPAHGSRSLALQWALAANAPAEAITLRSAMAAGSPWLDEVVRTASGPSLRQAAVGVLGWSVPGDEDAGPAKLKDDIPTFERRIEQARVVAEALSDEARVGVWDGALHALRALPSSAVYASALDRLRQSLARLCWTIWIGLDRSLRPHVRTLPPMERDAFAALARSAPADARPDLRVAVIRWYAEDPAATLPHLKVAGEVLGESPARLGLEAVGQAIHRTNLARMALQLLDLTQTEAVDEEIVSAVVNLAVTAVPDDPTVATALDRRADAIVEGYARGTPTVAGPITFSRSNWARFNERVRQRLEDAAAAEAQAREEAAAATREADELRSLAEQRARTLAESRAASESEGRQDVGRLAANLLKPVALAAGDSFQGGTLESLQDRLLAVLQRGGISTMHHVGEVVAFDPVKHQWVGEGAPTDHVVATSPGFIIAGEGQHEVVLVPARVVGSTTD